MIVHSKRPDIERAALRLFVTRGVRGTTVRDIAIDAGGQRRHELGGIDPRLAAECIMGAVNRVAIYRRLGALPRRLAQYEQELVGALLAGLVPLRRRRAT